MDRLVLTHHGDSPLYRQVELNAHDRWPEYCDWLIDTVVKFRKSFIARIKAIKLDGDGPALAGIRVRGTRLRTLLKGERAAIALAHPTSLPRENNVWRSWYTA